jgi:predicted nucleic acid-binding protein
MVSAALLDSSIYISAFRTGGKAIAIRSTESGVTLWLSAVVLAELLAGARDKDTFSSLEELEYDFRKAQRLLVPEASDWSAAGKIMARLASRHNYETVGRGRLLNDVLIAVSAGRKGITVVTANARDFSRIAEFTPFHWREQLN